MYIAGALFLRSGITKRRFYFIFRIKRIQEKCFLLPGF